MSSPDPGSVLPENSSLVTTAPHPESLCQRLRPLAELPLRACIGLLILGEGILLLTKTQFAPPWTAYGAAGVLVGFGVFAILAAWSVHGKRTLQYVAVLGVSCFYGGLTCAASDILHLALHNVYAYHIVIVAQYCLALGVLYTVVAFVLDVPNYLVYLLTTLAVACATVYFVLKYPEYILNPTMKPWMTCDIQDAIKGMMALSVIVMLMGIACILCNLDTFHREYVILVCLACLVLFIGQLLFYDYRYEANPDVIRYYSAFFFPALWLLYMAVRSMARKHPLPQGEPA